MFRATFSGSACPPATIFALPCCQHCLPRFQEADFFFAMGSAGASAASAGTGSGAGAGGSRGGRRYVVGVVPASKLKECTEAIAQMVA